MEVWQHMKSTDTNRTRAFPRERLMIKRKNARENTLRRIKQYKRRKLVYIM